MKTSCNKLFLLGITGLDLDKDPLSFFGHIKNVTTLTLLKSNEKMILSSSYDGVIIKWIQGIGYSGKLERKENAQVNRLAAVDEEIITSGFDNKVWRFPMKKDECGEAQHIDIGTSTIAPDGSEAIVGGQDGKLHIYSVAENTLKEEAVLEKHRGAITVIRYSPDLSMFASADGNREAVVWDRVSREGIISIAIMVPRRGVKAEKGSSFNWSRRKRRELWTEKEAPLKWEQKLKATANVKADAKAKGRKSKVTKHKRKSVSDSDADSDSDSSDGGRKRRRRGHKKQRSMDILIRVAMRRGRRKSRNASRRNDPQAQILQVMMEMKSKEVIIEGIADQREMATLVEPPNGVRSQGKHYYSMWQTLFEIDTKYVPIKPIGRGAYGVVCSSINTEANEKVAIKKINNVFENRINALRTLRELKLLRHIWHENVIALKDVMMPIHRMSFKDVYLVYELMDTDLHQIIKSTQPLSNDHSRYFLFQIIRLFIFIEENHETQTTFKFLSNCRPWHCFLACETIILSLQHRKIDYGWSRQIPQMMLLKCIMSREHL